MSRVPLSDLRPIVLDELRSDRGVTATELSDRLGLHGFDWYKIALVLERAANDGLAELEKPGSTVRRFRRREM